MKLKKILKIVALVIVSFILFIAVYLLSAYILSHISVSKDADTKNDVVIFIENNGVHTDLVLPVKYGQTDWSSDIKFNNTVNKDSFMTYVAFGWGDKGFYLDTPTWADLKFSTAFKAAFGLSHAAIHATFYKTLTENASCKKMTISNAQYLRLVSYIRKSFSLDATENVINIKTKANYGPDDAFYEAKGSYNLFHTCNTWANNGLKSCGQKACLWTPFASGIFYHYK